MRKTNNRQTLLRLIHAAKKKLSMQDDSYRAILLQIGGKTSAAELSDAKLEQVLAHMKKCGFVVQAKGSKRALADDAQSTKIRALWLALADAGVVHNRSETALAAFVKKMTGVEALQWLSSAQASRVIEHLKKWQTRAGVVPEGKQA